jgi:DNA polymerase-3 subunit epsilon
VTGDWSAKPLLSIDTETTGVNTDEDRIVEVAAVRLDLSGVVLDSWSTIVDPGVEIPDIAAQIHGITTSRAMAEGVAPAKALQHVADLVLEAAHAGEPIVIYNATFDLPLLITECHRHDVDFYPFAPILDPLLIDRMLDRYRSGGRKLGQVAAHYGVTLTEEEAHGALADATASGRIMRRIVETHPQVGDRSLAWLWLRQVRGHEESRVSFQDYMRRTKDPDFESHPGWPIPTAVG